MRQLVSYDDIALPVPVQAESTDASPPRKRRKNNYYNHRQGQKRGGHRPQPRDDVYEDDETPPPQKTRTDYGLEEESRQLTHEEVWDDSALIRAWDAAVEEYEVLNGPEKKWKSEPVKKSPLWFNIPPASEAPPDATPGGSFLMPSIPAAFASEFEEGGEYDDESFDPDNSHPANFDTFVPRHDPSLSDAKNGADEEAGRDATGAWRGMVPPPPAAPVTSSEAFERAMGAWFWAGYWTGVYHNGVKNEPQRPEQNDQGVETVHEAMAGNIEREEAVAGNIEQEEAVAGNNEQEEAMAGTIEREEAMAGNIELEEQEVSNEQVEHADLIPT